jgi:hypothetical protein
MAILEGSRSVSMCEVEVHFGEEEGVGEYLAFELCDLSSAHDALQSV